MADTALHRFQTALLQRLKAGGDPAAIRRALVEDPALAEYRAHAEALQLHALAVAIELVAKWGRR